MHVNARLSSESSFNEDIMQLLFSLVLTSGFWRSAQTLRTSRLAEVLFAAHRGGSNSAAFGCLMENSLMLLKPIRQSDRSSDAGGQNGGQIEKTGRRREEKEENKGDKF